MNVPDSPRPFAIHYRFGDTGPQDEQIRPPEGHTADFSQVGYVVFRFQAWGDFVIDSFEIV